MDGVSVSFCIFAVIQSGVIFFSRLSKSRLFGRSFGGGYMREEYGTLFLIATSRLPVFVLSPQIGIMKQLNHRNIVRLHEVLSSSRKIYMVMDLVRGGELFKHMERYGETGETTVRKYFQQMVDGLDYCHRRGVCHRDLKPENLLVDERGVLKVTDFGVSAVPNALQHKAVAVRTFLRLTVLLTSGILVYFTGQRGYQDFCRWR